MKLIALSILSLIAINTTALMSMEKPANNPTADNAPLLTPPATPKTPRSTSVPSTPKECVAAILRHRSWSQSKGLIFDDADHPITSAKVDPANTPANNTTQN